jgi:hypothetical protein
MDFGSKILSYNISYLRQRALLAHARTDALAMLGVRRRDQRGANSSVSLEAGTGNAIFDPPNSTASCRLRYLFCSQALPRFSLVTFVTPGKIS